MCKEFYICFRVLLYPVPYHFCMQVHHCSNCVFVWCEPHTLVKLFGCCWSLNGWQRNRASLIINLFNCKCVLWVSQPFVPTSPPREDQSNHLAADPGTLSAPTDRAQCRNEYHDNCCHPTGLRRPMLWLTMASPSKVMLVTYTSARILCFQNPEFA